MASEQTYMPKDLKKSNSQKGTLNSSIDNTISLRTRITDFVWGLFYKSFVDTVIKGDILITGRGSGGLVGHAAIMIDDDVVLEMPGGEGWQYGIEDNNRQISKQDWYEAHKLDSTTVYRNKDPYVAPLAAEWANYNYYSRHGSRQKTEHITYKLTQDIWSKNPCYCSKLVLHAYHFGTGDRKVIRDLPPIHKFIVPSQLPNYFLSPYTVVNVGTF